MREYEVWVHRSVSVPVEHDQLGQQPADEPAATWRYWAARGEGPVSMKIGRRRVGKKTVVRQWLSDQEK